MMRKIKLKAKPGLKLIKTGRVRFNMDTSQKIIRPDKGKGSYSRKAKHRRHDGEETQ
jgi:hypothetical protein